MLSDSMVQEIYRLLKIGRGQRTIARMLNVSRATVGELNKRRLEGLGPFRDRKGHAEKPDPMTEPCPAYRCEGCGKRIATVGCVICRARAHRRAKQLVLG